MMTYKIYKQTKKKKILFWFYWGQDYFTPVEPSQSLRGAKMGYPRLVSHVTRAMLKPTVVTWRAIQSAKD